MKVLLPVREAADFLEVSPSAVRKAIARGNIKVIRTPGGRYLIPEEALIAYALRHLGRRGPPRRVCVNCGHPWEAHAVRVDDIGGDVPFCSTCGDQWTPDPRLTPDLGDPQAKWR